MIYYTKCGSTTAPICKYKKIQHFDPQTALFLWFTNLPANCQVHMLVGAHCFHVTEVQRIWCIRQGLGVEVKGGHSKEAVHFRIWSSGNQ